MRAWSLVKELISYRGNNDELYTFEDGATEADITEYIKKETEERFREWKAAKEAANVVQQIVEYTRRVAHTGKGSLAKKGEWTEAVNAYRKKYLEHRQACATCLPLSLSLFEEATQTRNNVRHDQYRRLLLSSDPVEALADAFEITREVVESTKSEPREYLEWTFLARYISQYARTLRHGPSKCIELTLQLMAALVKGTYAEHFPKAVVRPNGRSGHTFSLFSMNVDELNAMAKYMIEQTESGTDGKAAEKVLQCLEVIWGVPIPEAHREWLNVDPRQTVQGVILQRIRRDQPT